MRRTVDSFNMNYIPRVLVTKCVTDLHVPSLRDSFEGTHLGNAEEFVDPVLHVTGQRQRAKEPVADTCDTW